MIVMQAELTNPTPERASEIVTLGLHIAMLTHQTERKHRRQILIANALGWSSRVAAAAALGLSIQALFLGPVHRWWIFGAMAVGMLSFGLRTQLLIHWTRQIEAFTAELQQLSNRIEELTRELETRP